MGRTARGVALSLLDAFFGRPESPGGDGSRVDTRGIPLWSFQEEGLVRVRRILECRGGAILADSVGLGKTHIALVLIREAVESGVQVVVIVPASLRPFWRRTLRVAGSTVRARVRLLSHAQLARGTVVADEERRLLVVDEAHRFRNPRTLRYAALARLVGPGTRVLLVTATPVNNRIEDLLHLMRLFCADSAFRQLGIASVTGAFEAASEAGDSGPDGAGPDVPLNRLIREVVVRRTRAMVRDRFGEPAGFPRRAVPRVIPYDDPRIPARVAGIAALRLPLYPSGTAALVRMGLLKRLDSSRAAFARSVARLRAQHAAALDAVRAGYLPVVTVGRPGEAAGGDPLQLVLMEVLTRPAPPGSDLDELGRSLESELRRLERLAASDGGPSSGRPDPKLEALTRLLDGTLEERTLVFTEYRATAEAVWLALVDRYPTGRIDGGGAWLGRRRAGRRTVVERFAPDANGRPAPPPRERVDVLVATDVLAEGLNLQDARHMVCYDLPWNPVRLLQRIGRIDRAGSPHPVVFPFLFVPARGLDVQLGLTRRLRAKLGRIGATVGAEHGEALLEGLGRVAAAAPTAGAPADLDDALDAIEPENRDPIERLRTLWVRRRGAEPGRPQRPPGGWAAVTVPVDDPAADLAWVLGVRVRPDADLAGSGAAPTVRLLQVDRDGTVSEIGDRGVHALRVALEPAPAGAGPLLPPEAVGATAPGPGRLPVHARPTGSGLPSCFPQDAVREYLRRTEIVATAPPPLPPRGPAAQWAIRLRRALARAGSGLDPALLADADAILARLASPQPPRAAHELRRLLSEPGAAEVGSTSPETEEDPERIMRLLRRALDRSVGVSDPLPDPTVPPIRTPGASPPDAGRIEVIGGLEVVIERPSRVASSVVDGSRGGH